jgi:hypothetical protein
MMIEKSRRLSQVFEATNLMLEEEVETEGAVASFDE